MSDLSQQDALLGARLGSSQIERPLGAGGMSAVYLASQERPRRSVAIKVLRSSLAPGRDQWPIFLGRFRREADAMAALDHANITPIFEFGEQDDLAYLVMPYLPDGSLGDALERQGPLHVERAIAAVEQVAAALDYAHQHGIIHRDVKPSNVLIHPDGRLLLSDFGIARPLDKRELPLGRGLLSRAADSSLTMAGAALGTPDYMAPEQILGEKVSPATDVYALGALAYTLLAGRPPFRGGGTERTLDRQLNEPPQPLRLDRPDIPPRVEEAIFWALAKDPADRPESAGALAKALRAGLRAGPLAAGAALLRRAGMPGQFGALAAGGGREPSGASLVPDGRGSIVKTTRMEPGAFDPARMEPSDPGDSTVWDARYSPHASARNGSGATNANGAPIWPAAPRRPVQTEHNGIRLSPAVIVGILTALVVLLVMAVMLGSLLSDGALAALTGTSPTTSPGIAGTATTPPSPTPSPSPTVPPNWLSVTPNSLTLGCSGASKRQQFTITNIGNDTLDWRASASSYGISLSSHSGSLDPQQHKTITVTNNGFIFVQGGEITISPSGDNQGSAGAAAVVSYSIDCGGGNQGG